MCTHAWHKQKNLFYLGIDKLPQGQNPLCDLSPSAVHFQLQKVENNSFLYSFSLFLHQKTPAHFKIACH